MTKTMRTTRQALLYVTRELLEHLMPDWRTIAKLRYGDVLDGCEPRDWETLGEIPNSSLIVTRPFREALKLPTNCIINGISYSHRFAYDQITFKIGCSDFVQTTEGGILPEVRAVYNRLGFVRWEGPAVRVEYLLSHTEYMEREGRQAESPTPKNPPHPGYSGVVEYATGLENEQLQKEMISYRDGKVQTEEKNGEKAETVHVQFDTAKVAWDTKQENSVIPTGVSLACWSCHNPTIRQLPDGTPECPACAEKRLL